MTLFKRQDLRNLIFAEREKNKDKDTYIELVLHFIKI